ncbi:uncharacterized protein A4U43_C09F8750 [Asparagus officinalis]|uniref:Uncharacterized protein n=1 Tax=Asparagus officinalis TaxID=4686 RepID=A0A5P1E692_ASPOF|nr:uncharacterized protein A4U43_C09F8750 [Asparagus officinalis]
MEIVQMVHMIDIYGPIKDIDLKIPPRPPRYAFVEVELAHGGRGHPSPFEHHRSSNGGGGGGRGGVSRHSNYRVKVTGLPSSASWQDLKKGQIIEDIGTPAILKQYLGIHTSSIDKITREYIYPDNGIKEYCMVRVLVATAIREAAAAEERGDKFLLISTTHEAFL